MKPFNCQNCKNKRHFNSAVNKQDMTSQKFPHTFLSNTCTDKLFTAATVLYNYKGFTYSNYKGSGEHEQTTAPVTLAVANHPVPLVSHWLPTYAKKFYATQGILLCKK